MRKWYASKLCVFSKKAHQGVLQVVKFFVHVPPPLLPQEENVSVKMQTFQGGRHCAAGVKSAENVVQKGLFSSCV